MFVNGVVPLAVEVVFFDADSLELGVSDFNPFFVLRVVNGTANDQSFARRRVTNQIHNRRQII